MYNKKVKLVITLEKTLTDNKYSLSSECYDYGTNTLLASESYGEVNVLDGYFGFNNDRIDIDIFDFAIYEDENEVATYHDDFVSSSIFNSISGTSDSEWYMNNLFDNDDVVIGTVGKLDLSNYNAKVIYSEPIEKITNKDIDELYSISSSFFTNKMSNAKTGFVNVLLNGKPIKEYSGAIISYLHGNCYFYFTIPKQYLASSDEYPVATLVIPDKTIFLPYNEKYQIYMQDENFMYKDPYPVEDIPKEKMGLLGNLHPLNLWRFQVCKQADIVLATFIMSDFFTKPEIEKIFDYYEPKTVHDSSLSAAIHSIVACSIGRQKDAYNYLRQSARMDLDNVNGNTRYGLHAACMGGARMLIVNGYAGLRIFDNALHFEPSIHDKWTSYDFKMNYKGNVLVVKVTKDNTTYYLESGKGLTIYHFGKEVKVSKDKVVLKNN